MKNRTMARTVMVAGLCLVGGALTGCFGDCFSDVKTSITVADNIPITAGKSIRIRVVPDATGSDAQGIPIDNNSNSVSNISLTLADGVRSYEAVVKNQAWQKMSIYAYIDSNDNFTLDSGEPFAVDAGNPVDLADGNSCKDHTSNLVIDRIRQ